MTGDCLMSGVVKVKIGGDEKLEREGATSHDAEIVATKVILNSIATTVNTPTRRF